MRAAARSTTQATRRRRCNRWPALTRRPCSGLACSGRRCWRQRSSRSRPPIRSARRLAARHESRHQFGRNRSYGTYALVVGVGALVVLVPGAPLVPILFITQAINAVLLLPLLAFIALLTRDRSLMGEYATGRAWTVLIVAVTLMIAAATVVLGVVLVGG